MKLSFQAGWNMIRRRPDLAVLVFLVHAAFGWIMAAPIGGAIDATFAGTGYGETDILDAGLLAEFFAENGGLLAGLAALFLAFMPVMLAWNTAMGLGLINAARDGGVRSFWAGVGPHFWRGLGLTLLFLIPLCGWTLVTGALGVVLTLLIPGEVAAFWVWFVLVPVFWIVGVAALDMMQDYARYGLVARGEGVMSSLLFGIRFPFRSGGAQALYLAWFVPGFLLALAPGVTELWLGAGIGVFVLQQVILLARAGVSVGWIASEVVFAESREQEKMPPIAESVEDPVALA